MTLPTSDNVKRIPGGVLPDDERIALRRDKRCSRCGEIPTFDMTVFVFRNKGAQKGLRYCENCLAKPRKKKRATATRTTKKSVAKRKKKLSKIGLRDRG